MYERTGYRDPPAGGGVPRLAEELLAWLRNRTVEQWLMFAGGLALGLLIG